MVTDLETRRILALLDRLDPASDGRCTVEGCTHAHATSSAPVATAA